VTLQVRVATFNIRNSSADDGADSWPVRDEATVAATEALSAEHYIEQAVALDAR
jgi:hypothetical protein